MEDNHFLDSNQLKVEKERPTFLTVLCIITFIVSGILLFIHVFDVISFDRLEQEEMIEEQLIMLSDMFNIEGAILETTKLQLDERLIHHTPISWMSIISLILSLYGAFMMFKMNKIGFHLYTVAKIIGLSTILFFTINSTVIMDYTITAIYSIAFVIMYAVNLKHMKTK